MTTIDAAPAGRRDTLPEALMARIEEDLDSGRFPPGAFMGAQADLCALYGVTPPIFRQATRVLADRGLLAIRPGKGGGVFALDLAIEQVGKRIATYLDCTGAKHEHAAPLAHLFQGLCIQKAAMAGVSIEAAAAVRAMFNALPEDEFERGQIMRRIFEVFADASGNIVFSLLHRAIVQVSFDITVDQFARSAPRSDALAKTLIDAIIAAEPDEAGLAFRTFTQQIDTIQVARQQQLELKDFSKRRVRLGQLPERLASHMLREIRIRSLPVGARIGSESELMVRYGVGRATLRHALRLLEEYSVVETRRGAQGGVLAAEPSADTVKQNALTFLRRKHATLPMVREVIGPLLGVAFDAAFNMPHAEKKIATAAMSSARGELTAQLLARAQNPILNFFVCLTSELENELRAPIPPAGRVHTLKVTFAGAAARRDRAGALCALAELVRTAGAP